MAGLRERFPPRRVLRLLGWNVLILFVLLALVAGGAEVYLRLTIPFRQNVLPIQMAPGVGVIWQPHVEIRYTNGRDFRQVSRTNSLGLVDREPPSPERAAASCHVTLIGDSFVDAKEVAIADKAQVRLEELAARDLPALDVTTSAFGRGGTGQINQLAFYDVWARSLSPDVVVLVFVGNDFFDNSLALQSWSHGRSPDHPPWRYARRGADGEMEFVPHASSLEELRANLLPRLPAPPESVGGWLERGLRRVSYVADWLWIRAGDGRRLGAGPAVGDAQRLAWVEIISQHPSHGNFSEGWDPLEGWRYFRRYLLEENPPPVWREALDVTVFALRQFRERAERDGAELVILAAHGLGGEGAPRFDLLLDLVARSGGGEIPVISQYDHIVAAGGKVEDAHWANDGHWNATGHRWAAEAILEWLKANPEVCD